MILKIIFIHWPMKKAVCCSSVRLGFCMSVILLVPRVVGVIIQNPSLILDVDA